MLGLVQAAAPLASPEPRRMKLEQIKQRMLDTLHDCEDPAASRIRYKVGHALAPADLWLIRSDLYQYVANRHNQTEAALRVNHLLPCFKGWVSRTQLSRI
jgi:hypothetical protein